MPLIAGAMLWQVLQTGPISYHLGGWAPPWGIEYRVDVLNAFVLLLVSAVGAVIMPFARRSVAFEIEEGQQAWFYCMYLLCLTGCSASRSPATPSTPSSFSKSRRSRPTC